jgi:hypothetical protein
MLVGASPSSPTACNAPPCPLALAAPAGLTQNDVLLACAYVRLGTGTSAVAGPHASWSLHAVPSPNGFAVAWLTHTVGAGEPSSYALSLGENTPIASAALVAYRGTRGVDVSQQDATLLGAPFVAPGVTTTVANEMLVACFFNDSGDCEAWGAVSGMTKEADTGLVGIFDAHLAAAGPTGARSASPVGGPDASTPSGAYVLVGLAPP